MNRFEQDDDDAILRPRAHRLGIMPNPRTPIFRRKRHKLTPERPRL